MPERGAPVLIAGGGIAGLAAALALAKRGFSARLFEREPQFSEAGAGIQLGPNAVRVLQELGAAALLAPAATAPKSIIVHNAVSGVTLTRLPLADTMTRRHGAPYWTVHRGDLLAALLAAARTSPSITLTLGFEGQEIAQSDAGVSLISTRGDRQDGQVLIGADGRWSRVRKAIFADYELPFSGYVAHRAIVDTNETPTRAMTNDIHIWLAPDIHVVHYPVRAGREQALVVVLEEAGLDTGWNTQADPDHLRRRTAGLAPVVTETIAAAKSWRKWALGDPAPFPAWTKGRITLAGDAAHPVLPFLAQGGGLALEDATILARALSTTPDEPERALASYEQARRGRAARLQSAARRNGRMYHASGFAAVGRDLALRLVPPTRLIASYDWLYGWRANDRETGAVRTQPRWRDRER